MIFVKILINIMLQFVFANDYKIHAIYLIADKQNFSLLLISKTFILQSF